MYESVEPPLSRLVKLLSLFQTEEQLVKACQKADPKAQRRVYEKYSARMLAVCRRYFKDEYEAEECMVEGFVKVFERISQFKLEGSFEGWIRRIVVNECLMALRSKKQLGWQTSYDEILYEPDPQLPETSLEVADLLKLVDQLPTGYRTVFNLYAIDGYSHEEIARTLQITESTSKSQLHRARALLQRLITETDARLSINY
ncbi:RNA polymerase subunit sigma-70 [Siphonobacter sp. BAB-5385]|nr:RNA polymerase subunit sigma-70 [Siphonobacter sp. BAB-5385]PMD95357.1 RNA polymerase subunit sigma-70 [Siphonobacter sp. BAB-5405]